MTASDVTPPDATASVVTARRTWLGVGSVAAVIGLAFGTVQVLGLVAHQERLVQASFDAQGLSTIDVTTDSGSIAVVGDSPTGVRVTQRISDGLRSATSTIERHEDRLVLRGSCPGFAAERCGVDYEIHMPPELAVIARTDDGTIDARDVSGAVDLSTDNGDVVLSGLSGRLQLSTDNGSIDGSELTSSSAQATSDNGDVTLGFSVAPTTVTMDSDNGDLVLVVPQGPESYSLTTSSDNGVVSTPIRTDPNGERHLTLRSGNGNITAAYPGQR